jgi:hypothetical protein
LVMTESSGGRMNFTITKNRIKYSNKANDTE